MRRGGSDEWESEEEEEENADRSDLADVVVFRVVRGANASPKISAPSRRLVSRREGGHRGIAHQTGEGEGGLIALPSSRRQSPLSHNGRFSFHFGPQKGSVKERPLAIQSGAVTEA